MRTTDYISVGERRAVGTLACGLNVIVVPKLEFTKSYAFFATDYGGADRRFSLGGKWHDTPSGVAHFLEHKMFDQPDGTNALTTLSSMGASPNAFTSSDITAYHFECAENFEEDLRVMLDFVMTPFYTEESVAKEQGIIGQEIRMTEDNPDFALYYDILKSLYKTNPIRDSVAGTVESISHITAQTLYDCHKAFYNPSNMVLCVAGDLDPDRVFEIAQQTVRCAVGSKPERDYGPQEGLDPVEKKSERRMEVGTPMFLTGVKSKAPEKGEGYLKRLLTGDLTLDVLYGRSSPFYSQMYAKGLINQGFSAEYDICAGVAHVLSGGESKDPEAVAAAIAQAAADASEKGIDKAAFERIKKAALGRTLRGLNSFDSICYNTAKGYFKGYDYLTCAKVLAEITEDDAAAFAAEALTPDRLALSVIRPQG
ncbi:MAG: insulinase family protein [Oscillospiraceae bacterium]|nr:insulinase family protein [Oscillospiraceae bacterium]